jgi:hypothetical protein
MVINLLKKVFFNSLIITMAKKTTEETTKSTSKEVKLDVVTTQIDATESRVGYTLIEAKGITLEVESDYILITQYDSNCDLKSASKALQKVTDKRVSLSEDGRFTIDGKELTEWKTNCSY